MIDRDSRKFLEWWDSARQGRSMPRRRDLPLEQIGGLLPRLAVSSAISPTAMILRLTGTLIDQHAGRSTKGVNILDITPEESRDLRGQRLWRIATRPCGGVMTFEYGVTPEDLAPLTAITLPVQADAAGEPVQLFTLFSSEESTIWYRPNLELATAILMPGKFSYVDTGAGIPEDETALPLAVPLIFGDLPDTANAP